MTIKKPRRLIFEPISLFRTATKILLAFISRAAWHHPCYSTKVGHWRKDVLEGHAPFYYLIFSAKDVCSINFTVSFYLYLYLQPREKCFFFRQWITWWWHNIQGWKWILYFVSLAVWLSFRHAKLTAVGEGRVRILAIECAFFYFFLFASYRFSIFSRSNAHTHTNKGRCEDTRKGRKETESSSLHSISGLQINVWIGAFI